MYNHKEIEKKWQDFWEKNKTFKTNNPLLTSPLDKGEEQKVKPKYYCLDMFPYPSGAGLHVGHPEGYTANDIVARYKNAKGFNVLHPMGRDAFGLPAENYAIKTGTHPRITTDKNINVFREQIKGLGFSYDWDREIDTTNPDYYKWTQWIFLKLFEKGLAYEQDLPINYCPSCKTGLANEEVLKDFSCERCGEQVEKKKIRQWVLAITKYADRLLNDVDKLDWPESIKEMQRNWIGKSEGCEFEMKKSGDESLKISVYTTRIDTVFGVTYAVLAPDHKDVDKFIIPEQKEVCEQYIKKTNSMSDQDRTADDKEKTGVFTGSYVVNPFNGEKVPLWIADYVLGNYGTGAVMAVPAHDERDFEFAEKYDLGIKGVIVSEKLRGIKPKRLNTFIDIKGREFYLANDEAFTEYGVLVNSGEFNDLKSEEAKAKLTEYAEKNNFGTKKVNYKLRDWLFSRQRYWGEPIPLIHLDEKKIKNLPKIKEGDFEKIFNKKMRIATLNTEGVTPMGNTAKFSSTSSIFESIEKVKKINKKIILRWFLKNYKTKKGNIIVNGRYLEEHFKIKSRTEKNIRKRFSYTIFENLDKVHYFSENMGLIDINGYLWIIILEKTNNKNEYNLLTYYFIKSINDIYKNAYISKQKAGNYLYIGGKVFSKIYDGLYGKMVCDYNLPLKLPEVENYEPAGDGNSPLVKVEDFVNIKLASNLSGKRETNTMPQWGGSCWYYLRYMDPNNSEKLVDPEVEKYWGQVDSYVGGAEHAVLHLLYARFWHKFLFDIGVVSNDEPFYRLRNQGLIQSYVYENPKGKILHNDLVEEIKGEFYDKETGDKLTRKIGKMSKSLGNVINPDEIVNEYGADSLRLYEMYMAEFKDSAPWDTKNIIGVRRFIEKVERLFNSVEAKIAEDDNEAIKLLNKTIKKVGEDIENYKFNTAIAQMMILSNYGRPKDEKMFSEWKEKFAVILSPFVPHLAEELWEELNNNPSQPSCLAEGRSKKEGAESIFFAEWPEYDEKLIIDDTIKIGVQVLGKVRGIIEIAKDEDKNSVLEKAKNCEDVKKWIEGKELVKEIYVPGRIVNLVVKVEKKQENISLESKDESSKTEENKNYEKTGFKFVAILNKKIPAGKVMNALAHMTAGFVGTSKNTDEMGFIDYQDKDNSPHIASKHPFIILKAKNSNKLRALRNEVIEKGLHFSSFTSAMTVGSYEEQIEESKKQGAEDLEYYGICFFGKTEDLDEMTKGFSLWV